MGGSMMITEKKKGTLFLSARGPSRSRQHRPTPSCHKTVGGRGGEGGGTRIHPSWNIFSTYSQAGKEVREARARTAEIWQISVIDMCAWQTYARSREPLVLGCGIYRGSGPAEADLVSIA